MESRGKMRKTFTLILLGTLCVLLAACAPGPNFEVNSDGDEPDANIGDGICETTSNTCTLRAAIMEANHTSDSNLITFNNVSLIKPATALPQLTSGNITIDGGGNTTLDGSDIEESGVIGLDILESSFNVIQGLKIRRFHRGIVIQGENGTANNNTIGLAPGSQGNGSERNALILNIIGVEIRGQNAFNNSISGNHIGTNHPGISAKGNEYFGVNIMGGAHDNLVGSLTSTDVLQGGNLISGGNSTGVKLSNATNNHISGNYIGASKDGESSLANSEGIRVSNSDHNVIGISSNGDGFMNLISGNEYDGIIIEASDHNIIAGNHIGTDKDGASTIGNRYGLFITYGSTLNIIGTNGDGANDTAEGNLISGNQFAGIKFTDANTIKNWVAGNYIGTDSSGTSALGNGTMGISVDSDLTSIGTNGDGVSDHLEGNLISGNNHAGIVLNAFSAHVAGNLIGTDITGTLPIGNFFDGIMINSMSHGNRIGTNGDGVSDTAETNLISGNGIGLGSSAGIDIHGDDNTVAGNYIGTNGSGTAAIGNLYGILLRDSASGNLIGTDGDGNADAMESNLISGNDRFAVWFSGAYLNTLAGNKIGTDWNGTAAIPNGQNISSSDAAVLLNNGASGNIVGTNSDGSGDGIEGNLISGNALRAVAIKGNTTHGNIVAGNKIGTDATGTSALGNAMGVDISSDAYQNQIGTDGDGNSDFYEGNIISGNGGPGIYIRGSQNLIAGNSIGTDPTGAVDLGNGTHGISVANTSSENTIGGSIAKLNRIAFNAKDGIQIQGSSADKTLISSNSIHSNGENGIDLIEGGQALMFSPNDPGDLDIGPNDMMNFPELTHASTLGTMVSITGEINNGLPNTQFVIEFFSNPACDAPSNHGEGKSYLGSSVETTDGNGNASFLVSLSAIVPSGSFITSTATTDSKTSEFSACVEAADAQFYMEETNSCDQFDPEQMTVTTFGVRQDTGLFILYVKNPFPFPADDEWEYSAMLGEIPSSRCNFQGFEDRLYCDFILPESYHESAQTLQIISNICTPILIKEDVSIFITKRSCSADLGESACEETGGNYRCAAGAPSCECICP